MSIRDACPASDGGYAVPLGAMPMMIGLCPGDPEKWEWTERDGEFKATYRAFAFTVGAASLQDAKQHLREALHGIDTH